MTTPPITPLTSALILLGGLALVHATFQLGVSVLTLLSGHSLGRRSSLRRLLRLNSAYIIGAWAMQLLVLGATTYVIFVLIPVESYVWPVLVAWSCLAALLVVATYYRRGPGTVLWLPRSAANYLTSRAKATKNVFEAAVLGGITVLGELPLTLVIVASVGYLLMRFVVPSDHMFMMALYSFVVTLPLIVITVLLAGGHRLSTIQRWRESNKTFLQYAAAAGLLASALYMLVFFIAGGAQA